MKKEGYGLSKFEYTFDELVVENEKIAKDIEQILLKNNVKKDRIEFIRIYCEDHLAIEAGGFYFGKCYGKNWEVHGG